MKPKDILSFYDKDDGIYEGLNTMILLNFAILRALKQFDKLDGLTPGTYTAKDLFSPANSRKNELYDEAVEDIVSRRNAYSSQIQKVMWDIKNNPDFLKEFQDALIADYNNYYGTSKAFGDVFDGLVIKDQSFICDINKNQLSDNPAFQKLMVSYTTYMKEYKDYTATKEIIADLFDAYKDDISSYGNITYNYGKPTNRDVYVLDKETVEDLALSAMNLNKAVTEEQKIFEKTLEKLAKSYSKREPDADEEQVLNGFFEEYLKKCMDRQLADQLANEIGRLYYRFDMQDITKYANVFVRTLENIADIAVGLTPITKSNCYKPKTVYVHKKELDEIFTLFKILEHYDNAKYSDGIKQKFNLDEETMQKGFIL